jgi:hypothetical protein
MRTGATLAELSLALTLLALAAAALLPGARRQADRAALVGAREELAALVARTRGEAIARGGASLWIQPDGRASIEAGDSVVAELDLAAGYAVALESAEAAVELRFDGMGVGRVASRTLVLRRGAEEAELVLSAYGRVVRR